MKKQPMTWFNRLALTLLVLTAAFAIWRGMWPIAVPVLLIAAIMFPFIRRAQHGKDTPYWRVGLMQPYDERDRLLDLQGAAVLGKVLFIAQMIMVFVSMILGWHVIEEFVRFLVISVILAVVQAVAVKRG